MIERCADARPPGSEPEPDRPGRCLRSGRPVLVPDALGAPERVEVADPAPDGAPRVVSLFYRSGTVRMDAFDGRIDIGFLKTSSDRAEWRYVNGLTGLYFPRPHAVAYIDRTGLTHTETARLAGPTLVWEAGPLTYRLEGPFTVDEAIAVAGSVR
jgi:hypothetical protein